MSDRCRLYPLAATSNLVPEGRSSKPRQDKGQSLCVRFRFGNPCPTYYSRCYIVQFDASEIARGRQMVRVNVILFTGLQRLLFGGLHRQFLGLMRFPRCDGFPDTAYFGMWDGVARLGLAAGVGHVSG